MRLIDADKLIEKLRDFKEWENDDGRPIHTMSEIQRIDRCINFAQTEPTAHDVDKVIEELEERQQEYLEGFGVHDNNELYGVACGLGDAIKTVKHGGVSNRKDCEYRHENGNCLKVGGFCTSVDDKHCEKIKQGGVSDDVCEWEKYPFDWFTGCDGYRIYNKQGDYCPRCGKRIKVKAAE